MPVKKSDNLYLFISPHLDDVALSCGGYVHRLAAAGGEVIIVTLATASPSVSASISTNIKHFHSLWGLKDGDYDVRRNEDITACKVLGVKHEHLGLLDAIYRNDENNKPLYMKRISGDVNAIDWTKYEPIVRQKIQEIITKWKGWQIYCFCPLSIGGHVDHVIVHKAVEEIKGLECLIYYEDYPYSHTPNGIKSISNLLRNCENWRSITIGLTPVEIQARIEAVACYSSQIPGLFPLKSQQYKDRVIYHLPRLAGILDKKTDLSKSLKLMLPQLKEYIKQVGGERYWLQAIGSCKFPEN